ncbi:MAG: EamA family transporter RarD [Paracoccaceae bacterium]|nr:EamA family transporter RarD [Paracoccaceae bacterium]
MDQARSSILAMVAACAIWGLSPLYYKLLSHVPAGDILAHRTIWSLFFFAGVLAFQGRLSALRAPLGSARAIGFTLLAAVMISANWFLFILSVLIDRITEASLGYYVYPLVAVLFGVLLFGERLGLVQWLAVALAALAVIILTLGLGTPPWIALVLATTFGVYTVVKKRLAVGPVVSVAAEVLVLTPLALIWLFLWRGADAAHWGADLATWALLMGSGVMTALPLILFSRAAQGARMATVGLLQYINPTLQFLCAVVIFGEPFGVVQAVTFGLIWLALVLYSVAGLRQDRARRRMSQTSAADDPV